MQGSIQAGSNLTKSAKSSPVPSMPGNSRSVSLSSSIGFHTTKCIVGCGSPFPKHQLCLSPEKRSSSRRFTHKERIDDVQKYRTCKQSISASDAGRSAFQSLPAIASVRCLGQKEQPFESDRP